MDADFKQQVKKYLDAYKKRKHRIVVACILSACTILSVYGALLRPAISQETDSGMTLSASPSETTVGNTLTLCVAAKAKDSQPETYFLIATKSTGAGVVGLDFEDDVAVVPTVNATTMNAAAVDVTTVNDPTVNSSSVPSVELHRIVKNGNASYWFVLEKGENAEFQLKCIANAPKQEDTTTPAALSGTISDTSSATISETTASAVSSAVTRQYSQTAFSKASNVLKMKKVTMSAAASASSTASVAPSSNTSSNTSSSSAMQTLTARAISAASQDELLASAAYTSGRSATTMSFLPTDDGLDRSRLYPGKTMDGRFTYRQITQKNAYSEDSQYSKYYNSNCLLGIAGNFGIVAFGTVTTGPHCNSNILANTLVAGANFGTNNVDELSYIQHYQTVNSGSASKDSNVLVVGSATHVYLEPNGDAIDMNSDPNNYSGTKIDHPHNICKDKNTATSPFIDLNMVKQQIVNISNYLAGQKTTANIDDRHLSGTQYQNTYLYLKDPDGVGVYNISAAALNKKAYLGVRGFVPGHNGTVIINVNCTDAGGSSIRNVSIPQGTAYLWNSWGRPNETEDNSWTPISTGETSVFDNCRIIWNFVNADATTKIETTGDAFGVFLAPNSDFTVGPSAMCANLVANNIKTESEFHRNVFVGKLTNGVSVLKQWKDQNGNLLSSHDLPKSAYANVYITDTCNRIYDVNGNVVSDKSQALVKLWYANNWSATWANLPACGEYTVHEDSYNDGSGGTNNYALTIDDKSASGGLITLTNVPQKPSGYTLPSTGGGGAAPYTIGGLLLISAALWFIVAKAKRGRTHFTPEHKKTVNFNPKNFLEKEGVINMKFTKKLVSALLTVAMVATFPLAASAVGTGTNSIEIDGKEANHTYEAYQVLKGTLSGGKLTNVDWGAGVDSSKLLTAVKADTAVSSTFASATDAASFAQAMAKLQNSSDGANAVAADISNSLSGTVAGTSTANGTIYTISGLDDGYYFVKDKDGSVGTGASYTKFILNVTGGGTSKVVPKTDTPTVAKKVMENDAAYNDSVKNAYHDAADWNTGDAVPFQIAGTVPDMSNYKTYTYTFTDTSTNLSIQEDTMKVYWVDKSAGASANDVAALTTMNKTEITSGFTKTMATDKHGFTLTFDDLKATLANTNNPGYIVVDYKATLDSTAVIATDGNLKGNPNTVNLTYSNNPNGSGTGKTPDDTVVVFTYKIPVQKMDGTTNAALTTAQFALYKTADAAKAAINKNDTTGAITFTSTADGTYTYSSAGTVAVLKSDTNGKYDIKGLDEGTYYLAEIKVPAGYNVPTDAVKVTVTPTFSNYYVDGYVSDSATAQLIKLAVNDGINVVVKNNQGSVLPTTGGMGTVIFTVLGIVLMAGAAIVLITKKRISNKTN